MSDKSSRSPFKNLLSLFYALGICAVAGSAFYFLALQPAATLTQPEQKKPEQKAEVAQPPRPASAAKPQEKPAEMAAKKSMQDATRAENAQARTAKAEAEETEQETLPGDPGAGKKLYAQHCAACHGADASGQIGPALDNEAYKYGKSPEALTESITNGRPGGMPSFGSQLSDVQIENLVAYIHSL